MVLGSTRGSENTIRPPLVSSDGLEEGGGGGEGGEGAEGGEGGGGAVSRVDIGLM